MKAYRSELNKISNFTFDCVQFVFKSFALLFKFFDFTRALYVSLRFVIAATEFFLESGIQVGQSFR